MIGATFTDAVDDVQQKSTDPSFRRSASPLARSMRLTVVEYLKPTKSPPRSLDLILLTQTSNQ
jgi:hypothetical protein